jgi:hypothetical protein
MWRAAADKVENFLAKHFKQNTHLGRAVDHIAASINVSIWLHQICWGEFLLPYVFLVPTHRFVRLHSRGVFFLVVAAGYTCYRDSANTPRCSLYSTHTTTHTTNTPTSTSTSPPPTPTPDSNDDNSLSVIFRIVESSPVGIPSSGCGKKDQTPWVQPRSHRRLTPKQSLLPVEECVAVRCAQEERVSLFALSSN